MITKAVKGDFSPNAPGVLDRFQTRMIVLVAVVSASLLLPELQVWFASQANAPNDVSLFQSAALVVADLLGSCLQMQWIPEKVPARMEKHSFNNFSMNCGS